MAKTDSLQAEPIRDALPAKIEIRYVHLSSADLDAIRSAARMNAAKIGLAPDEWERRRNAGDPLANDILMTVDPDRFLRGE